jgi:hypothetical protein
MDPAHEGECEETGEHQNSIFQTTANSNEIICNYSSSSLVKGSNGETKGLKTVNKKIKNFIEEYHWTEHFISHFIASHNNV